MIDVGGKVRALRRAKSLSQRELSARCGLTNGAISMIEQNQTSPSVATLKKLLDALGVTLSGFFTLSEADAAKVFFRRDELLEVAGGDAAVSLRQVGAAAGALQLLYERYRPAADTGDAMLSHESEEGGVVVSGEIEVTVGGQRELLRAGDAYLFDSRQPHRFRNVSDEDCVIVSACTPPSF